MKFKGSQNPDDKKMILIARECGTYIVRLADIKAGDDWANALVNHYTVNEHSKFYFIDLEKLEVKKIAPEEIR